MVAMTTTLYYGDQDLLQVLITICTLL